MYVCVTGQCMCVLLDNVCVCYWTMYVCVTRQCMCVLLDNVRMCMLLDNVHVCVTRQYVHTAPTYVCDDRPLYVRMCMMGWVMSVRSYIRTYVYLFKDMNSVVYMC